MSQYMVELFIILKESITKRIKNNKGAMMPFIAVLLPIIIGYLLITIDVGRMMVAYKQMTIAADAGAKAGAVFSRIYFNQTGINPVKGWYDLDDVIDKENLIRDVVQQNLNEMITKKYIDGQTLSITVTTSTYNDPESNYYLYNTKDLLTVKIEVYPLTIINFEKYLGIGNKTLVAQKVVRLKP